MKEYLYEILDEIYDVLKWIIPPKKKAHNFAVSESGKLSFLIFLIHRNNKFFENLKRLILYLNENPNLKIESLYEIASPYFKKHIRAYDYEKFLISQNNPHYKFYNYIPRITLNTNENRFVAFFLDRIISDLEDMIRRMKKKHLNEFENELNDAEKIVRDFISLRSLTFLGTFEKLPAFEISERITSHPIYLKIFKMFLNYGGNLFLDDIANKIDSFLEDWRIFELYVFFKIKKIFEKKYTLQYKPQQISEEMEADEIFNNWEYDFGSLKLYYQKSFYNYYYNKKSDFFSTSVNLRPDIIILKNNEIYIFDAKHKNSPEDIDYKQMHTYRDAIRIRVNGKVKRAVKYAIIVVPDEKSLEEFKEGLLKKTKYIKKARIGYIEVKSIQKMLKTIKLI